MSWTISATGGGTANLQPRRGSDRMRVWRPAGGGFTLIELLVVVAVLAIVMAMVGYIMVKALEIKSVSENRLDDLIGGLAAGRLLEKDLRSLPAYSDPTLPAPNFPYVTYRLDRVTLDGKANQPVLYLRSTADQFAGHNGDSQYVRWYVKNGILCRETLDLKTGVWLDLDTVTDLELAPFEVLRGVAWTVDYDGGDPGRLQVEADMYPSLASHHRIEVNGEPPESLANNERPRSMLLQLQISRVAQSCRLAQEVSLP